MSSEQEPASKGEESSKRLLLIDDDRPFLQRLSRAMESRGFSVITAETVAD